MMRRTSSTGSWSLPADPGGHRFAVHVSHDEVDQPLPLADGVDRDDVGMGQPRRRLRLAGEALPDVLLEGELGRKHLDGHPPLQPLVAGAIHHAHAAPADLALDGVGVPQSGAKSGRAEACERDRSRQRGAGAACGKLPCCLEKQPNMADNLYRRCPCGLPCSQVERSGLGPTPFWQQTRRLRDGTSQESGSDRRIGEPEPCRKLLIGSALRRLERGTVGAPGPPICCLDCHFALDGDWKE